VGRFAWYILAGPGSATGTCGCRGRRGQVAGPLDHLFLGDLDVFDRNRVGDFVEAVDDRCGLAQVQHHWRQPASLAHALTVAAVVGALDVEIVAVGVRVWEGGGEGWVFGESFGEFEVSFDVGGVDAMTAGHEFGGVTGTDILRVAEFIEVGQQGFNSVWGVRLPV
jgi:hypothetical protein